MMQKEDGLSVKDDLSGDSLSVKWKRATLTFAMIGNHEQAGVTLSFAAVQATVPEVMR